MKMDKKLVFSLVFLGTIAIGGASFWFFGGETLVQTPKKDENTSIQVPSMQKKDITKITALGARELHSAVESIIGTAAERPGINEFLSQNPESEDYFLDPNAPPLPGPNDISLGFKKKNITETELFNRIWPPDYINGIRSVEKLMIQDGFITTPSPLATDEDIYGSMERMLDYAIKKSWIAEKDTIGLRKGIREVLPALIEEEKQGFLSGFEQTIALPKDQRIVYDTLNKKKTISELFDGLKHVLLMAHPAKAVTDVPIGWFTSPDCYKDLNPYYGVPGVNLWDFCCNCGLRYVGVAVVYIDNCGPFSTACDIPLGCLNLVCAAWPNAVWDAWWYASNPPGNVPTGICGCG
ncbi:MAG: hypothetical protein HYW88_01390 [Candidatus Sungbacteria bacterium]|nr:hypothetical protein [Candidatus Sungbacteria bacterium]